MTDFVVPCGTSVLDRMLRPDEQRYRTLHRELLAWVKRQRDDGQALRTGVDWVDRWCADRPTVELDPASGDASLDLVGKSFREWSAELSGLNSTEDTHPVSGGRVMLLTSDTDEGVLAAFMVATALTPRFRYLLPPDAGGDTAREVEVTVAPDVPRTWDDVTVDIVRIEGLTVRQPEQFISTAVRGLGAALRSAVVRTHAQSGNGGAGASGEGDGRAHPGRGPDLVLHLAGGFKPTVPLLWALSEYLEGAGPAGDVHVYCKHEQGDKSLWLPRRRLQHAGLAEFLAAVRAAERGAEVSPWDTAGDHDFDALDGFAFEVRPSPDSRKSCWKLTLIGEGLLALLGEPSARLPA